MRKLAIALLATTMVGAPAYAATSGSQQPQANQTGNRMQPQSTATNRSQRAQTSQNSNQVQPKKQSQSGMQGAQGSSRQTAQNMPNNGRQIPASSLSRNEIRQVQQALDKDGFNAGRTDGRWGPETRNAVKEFQQSEKIQTSGSLNRQTVADLGLNVSQFVQSKADRKGM